MLAYPGLQDYSVAKASTLASSIPAGSAQHRARRARDARHDGHTGLLTIGQPKAGETVVVAAATGPVGSAVGKIAASRAAGR